MVASDHLSRAQFGSAGLADGYTPVKYADVKKLSWPAQTDSQWIDDDDYYKDAYGNDSRYENQANV